MADKFPDLEEYTEQFINKCEKYNNIPYIRVKNIQYATHWMPLEHPERESSVSGVTIGKAYRLLFDAYEDESIIIDDHQMQSLIYLCHHGRFITMQGSSRWNKLIKHLWQKEYQKTDEWKEMMRQSSEASRNSWQLDDFD